MADKKSNIKKKERTTFQKTVNVFLYTGIVFLILFIISFALSQTSTFRNYLKNFIVEKVNDSINGKLSIERLDGTIFTTITLNKTLITLRGDTVLNADKIDIKTSPLDILIKEIFVRNLEVTDTDIRMIKNEDGKLNVSSLFKSSTEDSASSKFPFKIVLSNFALKNINFSLKSRENIYSEKTYDYLNMNDLRITNLNLKLDATIDIGKNFYETNINTLSLSSNLNSFNIKNISGKFLLSPELISGAGINIETTNSNIELSSKISAYDLFDTTGTSILKNATINADIESDLGVRELGIFVDAFKNSKEKAYINAKLSGKFGDISLHELELSFLKTQLKTNGKIYNLNNPSALSLNINFKNSFISEPDIAQILPGINLPVYANLGTIKIDTLNFEGQPLDFKTKMFLKTETGNVAVQGSANFKQELIKYDLNFRTTNFDLNPIVGFSTSLTTRGQLKGVGSNPQNLTSTLTLSGDGSKIKNTKLDSLRLTVNADKKNILYNISGISDTSSVVLSGIFDFTDKENPGYDIEGVIRNLNYSEIFNDSVNTGIFNFYINGTGQYFDIDRLNLYLGFTITNSVMNGVAIDSSHATFNIISSDNDRKSIKITSDLADLDINGKFSLPTTISMLVDEAGLLNKVTSEKINTIIYPDSVDRFVLSPIVLKKDISIKKEKNKPPVLNDLGYKIKLKDFFLLSIFMKNQRLEIDGEIKGKIKNINDNVNITINTTLASVKYWGGNNIFFLSNLNMASEFENNLYAESLNDIRANIDLKTKRVFTGSDIHDFLFNLQLKNNLADLKFSGRLENYLRTKVIGKIDMSGNNFQFDLDSLGVIYNNFNLHNQGNLRFSLSGDNVEFNNFILVRNQGEINLKGKLLRHGLQNLALNIKQLKGKDVSSNFFELNINNSPGGDINLFASITGNFSEPVIKANLTIDSVSFKNKSLGFINSYWNYKNQNLNLNFLFQDSLHLGEKSPLRINGNVPMDLAFTNVIDRWIKTKNMDVKILANNFNLNVLGDMLPEIKNIHGFLDADLAIKGTVDQPEPYGFLKIKEGSFLAEINNLEYQTGFKVSVDNNELLLDSLLIKNSEGTANGGTMTGTGKADFNNFEISSSRISLNGQLKVLSEASKAVSPSIYGDLVIGTNGNLQLNVDADGTNLIAPINVELADLTIPQAKRGYRNYSTNFMYRNIEDTVKVEEKEIDFESLVALSHKKNLGITTGAAKQNSFKFRVNVNIQKEAKLTLILDQEFNQVLTTVLKGNFQYQQRTGRPFATGELILQDGSTLDFLTKTFQADGSLRFESDLSNPYLDIVGTYKNYYNAPSADSTRTNEIEVAVKLKLKGPLKDLGKNFIQKEDNIAVYYGADNIDNDIADKTKDASDAIMFIVTGQFLNSQGGFSGASQNSAFESTASTLAGSLLGGFLNSYAGDYVRSVELRRVGSNTKFNLTGRVNNFRYSIGGTTDVFSDLSRANLRIEYPFFEKLFLRLERKESLTETNNTSGMINELGLKYKFEF